MHELHFTNTAEKQISELDRASKKKILKAFGLFEAGGPDKVETRRLDKQIWEIKADNVRAYYGYCNNESAVVLLVVLKKTKKAPKRFIEQANRLLEKYIKELEKMDD